MDKKTKAKKTIPDTICRVHRSGGYAVLSNCFVRSTNIGCDSIGLLGKINDLPPTWNFTIAGLVAICEDGETAIKSQLAELEQWGYVKKTLLMPNESPTGRISYLYDFYEYSELDDSIPKYDIEMETFTADNATLNRVKKDSNFTIISAKLLRTNKIRNKLIGFMLKVLSLPNSWNFSMSGLKAICKEGKTAVHNAVNKLIDMGYLVRTKLLSNESVNNHFEYVYSFFDVPVSKEEADELEAETRRKAITIREGGKAKAVVSSSAEKQKVENPYLDTPPAETPLSENQGQYNNNNTKQKVCVFYPERFEFIRIISLDRLNIECRLLAVIAELLYLHKSFRTCNHSIETRKIACNIRKRRLYLRDKLRDSGQCTIADRTEQNAVTAVAHPKEIHSVHRKPEADIAEIGEMIFTHSCGFML